MELGERERGREGKEEDRDERRGLLSFPVLPLLAAAPESRVQREGCSGTCLSRLTWRPQWGWRQTRGGECTTRRPADERKNMRVAQRSEDDDDAT